MKSDKVSIWLKLAITTTFVLGALIFMYPFVANIINTQVDKHRIETMAKQTKTEEAKQLAKKKEREEEIKKNPHLGMKLQEDIYDEVESSSRLSSEEIKDHLIGSISIPKINAQLPIFDTTTPSFLQEGITLLPGSSYPSGGKGTHSVLTGHTGLPNKKLLTDLKDIVEGDVFYINVLGETLAYKVDQLKVVLPNELDDLKIVEGKDYLTLVTCTPYMVNTHRLLVRGERIPINYQAVKKVEQAIDKKNKFWLIFYLVLIALLLLLMAFVIYRQFINYQVMKRKYRLSFTVLKNGKPQKNLTFMVMDKSKRHSIKQNKKEMTVTTNDKGKVILKGLYGNKYWLIPKNELKKPLEIRCWVKRYKNELFEVSLGKTSSDSWRIKTSKRKKK